MNIRRNINTCRNVIIMKEKWFCITGMCVMYGFCARRWASGWSRNWLEKYSCKCQARRTTTTIQPFPSIRLFCHFSTSLYLFISRATAISCLRSCLCVYMFLVYYWFRLWSFVYTLDHPFVLFCFVFFTLIFFSHYSFASSFYFQNFDCCVCVSFDFETLED